MVCIPKDTDHKATLEICINLMKITSSSKLPSWALPLITAFALTQVSSALLTINYSVETNTAPAIASSLFGPKGEAAGTQTWNQGFAPSFSNLRDINNVTTPVDLSITVSATYNVAQVSGDTPMPLLKNRAGDSVRGSGNFITMTLSSLTPGQFYRVWVASGIPSVATVGGWTTPNSTSTVGTQFINNNSALNPGTNWIRGNNYVLFDDVVVDSAGRLIVTGVSSDSAQLPLSGFQIFQLDKAPEPSTAMLGGLGLLALFRRRRA